ncbi:unnamed protein product [Leptidea sinapis]|uniref:Uncharacterized protein n=1 Tax=Leptidea sinapis TaxID=189913 RepID=A0A5E4QRU1_9NEOP|nr:unnamed protein product [Leptidea sinapis]
MPPKLRGNKTSKNIKENIAPVPSDNIKTRNIGKKIKNNYNKTTRKALADKTNSASDDNDTIHPSAIESKVSTTKEEVPKRRRVRKIPARYAGNSVLTNLSNSKEISIKQKVTPVKVTVTKKPYEKKIKGKKTINCIDNSPLKNKSKAVENSIIKTRPKRIHHLPSKLDNSVLSPLKSIHLQPVQTSTPIANKALRTSNIKHILNSTEKSKSPAKKVTKKLKEIRKLESHSNNNGKKQLEIDKCFRKQENINKIRSKRLLDVDFSFKVLDDGKKSLKRSSNNPDPYEFTFDPKEEPQKKKKKRVVKKTQSKPKTYVPKGNYEKNLAKALASLKNNITKTTQECTPLQSIKKMECNKESQLNKLGGDLTKSVNEGNYNSVRIEDIAMDLQEPDDTHNLNYSPVTSPHHTPRDQDTQKSPTDPPTINKDPLKLQDLSFFDDQPIASSSMNVSARHPLASPWRVEFGSLPIKWQVNTYVKPNMTPAVESSFINPNDSRKKYVYTNIIPQTNEPLPEIASEPPNLKQTSIISFIKEVVEKSAKKKQKSTPVKENSIFGDITNTSNVTPIKNSLSKENSDLEDEGSFPNVGSVVETVNCENSKENKPSKTPNKKESKRNTCFGFDESEDPDQENISPNKKDKRIKSLRPRARAVLQEINDMKGPTRAVIPVTLSKVLNADNLNKHEGPKSGTEPPVFPANMSGESNMETNLCSLNDDSQTPPQKSYGKPKKVIFRQNSASSSDTQNGAADENAASSDEDNLEDLSFQLPTIKPKKNIKKKKPKKQLSKKEEKAADEWAAGFNSMCEDVEEFDLVVE